jgi:predicted alpha-1,2-mannosidase
MKRVLKWIAWLLLVIFVIPVLGLLGAYAYHKSIVSAGPGVLEGAPAPVGLAAKADPFIATGGFPWMSGLNSVAACVPFGMARLGPDTMSWFQDALVLNRSGYHYGDNKIIGFSHNRLVGADAKEGGAFRVFPTPLAAVEEARKPGRFVKFSHAREHAIPGYYGVALDNGVKAEMAATTRTGIHRYTFPAGSTPVLLIDVASALGSGRCENVQASLFSADPRSLAGAMRAFGSFSGRYDGLDTYFHAMTSEAIVSSGVVKNGAFAEGEKNLDGAGLLELHFAPAPEARSIELRLALSYVSIENARQNLLAEAEGKTFEQVVGDAQSAWNGIFDRIKIGGATPAQERIFYTALMRAFTMPTTFNDVNGQYTGFDKQVHTAEGFTYYTDFSIWDTFRTVHPLYTLIAPKEHTDMLRSLTEMVKQGGALPRWPSGAGYTNCMFGTPADILVSEAYQKGLRDFDVETAYAAARQTALVGVPAGSRFGGRQGLAEYLQYGYCPYDKVVESVACTIDYSWCDYSLAQWALALGKEDDAAIFAEHAQSYKKVWNPETLFFQGRDTAGNFDPNFSPLTLTYIDPDKKYTGAYVEGSAMQWRWGGPFDPEGLIALWPSKKLFVSELTSYMQNTRKRVGWWNPGGNYWHGNEPFIHAAYLFNAAGRPDLTQRYVRKLLATKYSDDYVGLDGNDDGGTLSSWYIFSALGFYPVAGTTRYEIGSPLFTSAEIQMGNGKVLTISAPDCSARNRFVKEVFINDVEILKTHITHDEIKDGGTLKFTMDEYPPGKDPRMPPPALK